MENIAYNNAYTVTTLEEFFGDYSVTTIDEYFDLLDRETQKRSKMIAKSLKDYLRQVKHNTKYDHLKNTAMSY